MTMTFPPLPAPLPDDVLARRDQLPLKPMPVVLAGKRVRLEVLDGARDAEVLYTLTNGSAIDLGGRHVNAYDADELVWRYMGAGPFATLSDFRAYLDGLNGANALPFTVFDQATGQPVGVACMINNVPRDLKVELGSISYSPIAQRTGANSEATYLLLAHAFALGYRRLEWKCDALNERSRNSALRMGFQFEGIQEYHMIVKGRSRDTAWFRILDHEWDTVKAHLETLL
jgi:RimJ/RimL family protein N-acetyltransferase